MIDTSNYQTGVNGPLNQETIDFLKQVKVENKWSYKTLGDRLGVSGPFAHAILHKPSNITTSTAMQWIAQGIEKLKMGLTAPSERRAPDTKSDGLLEHNYHLRSDLVITVKLPEDITEREAERLSMFIKSLSQ